MGIDPKAAIADIDDVLNHKTSHGGTGGASEANALMVACIERWTPPGSTYRKMMSDVRPFPDNPKEKAESQLRGIIRALRRDYDKDLVRSFEQLVHASLFSDLLEQAEHLLAERYLLPAAVITGSVLEEHLRKLATLAGISLVEAKGHHVKTSALNDQLKVAQVYSQVKWRQNQVWIDVRNEAAHGKDEFKLRTEGELRSMIGSVRELLIRHPA